MKNHEIERMEDRLTPPPAPAPPPDLLEKIQREIPEYLSVVPEPQKSPGSSWRVKLLAASVFLVVLSGAVVYQLRQSGPHLNDRAAMESAAAPVTPAPAKDLPDQLSTEGEATDVQGLEPAAEETEPAAPAPPPSTLKNESVLAAPESGELDDTRAVSESGPAPVEKRSRVETPPIGGTVAPAPEGSRPGRSDEVGLMDRDLHAESEIQPPPVWKMATEGSPSRQQRPSSESESPRALRWPGPGPVEETPARPVELPAAPPSTGGTAEPNDAPYGDMFFRTYGTNPFIDTEDDPLSTFGLDVDTGSFTLARSYLDRGHLPPPEAIRVEEFINYFDYDDPAPRRGEFALIAEGAPSPFADGPRYQLVRFAIKAREVSRAARPPAVLIFVVDVSGSMGRENRLELVKDSLELLLDELEPDDEIGLVVYGSSGEVLLEPTRSKESIRRAIRRLVPGGSTNAEEGLGLAYDLARRFYREGAIHRIILCSDGVANVGRTGPESILERVRSAADDGIELTTVGFGMGNYNDVLMEQLADQGDGSYAYVDSLDEAHRIFVENLTGMLQTIAADAKAQVEFNPATVSRYRLLGYENRDIADARFRDDTVDAGEIGAGHAVTALYEIKLVEGASRRNQRLATLRLRYRSKATGKVVESAIDLDRRHLAESWERASVALRLSSLAAEFAERLKGTYWARDKGYDDLERRLRPVADELAGDKRVEELVYLVQRARRLDFDSRNVIEE